MKRSSIVGLFLVGIGTGAFIAEIPGVPIPPRVVLVLMAMFAAVLWALLAKPRL